ncbi:MAG: acyl carrier protein [Rhodospirillales bacterium]|jgi:acyl carrier protein|nr:acyl carrier protein [Rhodospirillales bacterium]
MDEKLITIISRVFKIAPEDISEDLAAGDHENWDSVGHLELIMQIEEQFDFQFSMEEITELTSAKALDEALKTKGLPRG